MPNSIARRALAYSPSILVSSVLAVALCASLPAGAADPNPAGSPASVVPAGPPPSITAPFGQNSSFAALLHRSGVRSDEARAIESTVRTVLSAAQRKQGALIEMTFVGDASARQLATLRIEPMSGSPVTIQRSSIAQLPPLETAQQTASAAPAVERRPTPAKAATPGTSVAPLPSATMSAPGAVEPAHGSTLAQTHTVATAHDAPQVALVHTASASEVAAAGDDGLDWSIPPAPGKQRHGVSAKGTVVAIARGVIGTNVAKSIGDAGVPRRVASEIAEAAAIYEPLKHAKLAGSPFEVAYNPDPKGNAFVMASFTVNGVQQRLWRYRPAGSLPGFYGDDGARVGGLALQSPVPGAPIVSPFGMRRHPVLRVNKMHWGVDYAANTGTPIEAAADGVVREARRYGNYGLYIRIEHQDGVETTYGHMSGFARGIKPGVEVSAGQVIGYAGRTGLASGPHLYFEVVAGGKRINPAPLVSDSPLRLSGPELAAFEELKQQTSATETASW